MNRNNETLFLLRSSSIILNAVREISQACDKLFIITDENLNVLYGREIVKLFLDRDLKVHLLSIPPGEGNKTREMKAYLEDEMIRFGGDRKSVILAFGGGVVSDLAGFVAATFMRGIRYYILPTSLMAMVDASIGGKTAVNTPAGKNLIGALHFPQEIFIEPLFWRVCLKERSKRGLWRLSNMG